MYIHELSLQNYLCFTNASFNFNHPVSLIFGPNGSGKTAVLEAIDKMATNKTLEFQSDPDECDGKQLHLSLTYGGPSPYPIPKTLSFYTDVDIPNALPPVHLRFAQMAINAAAWKFSDLYMTELGLAVNYDQFYGSLVVNLSPGPRRILGIILQMSLALAETFASPDQAKAVVLIDNIDAFLDKPSQASVVHALTLAFPQVQFILTTLSEQVIGSIPRHAVHMLTPDPSGSQVAKAPFAEGATNERILIDLLGSMERAGQVTKGTITTLLQNYTDLVQMHDEDSVIARALRETLDAEIPGDTRLHQLDLQIAIRNIRAKAAKEQTDAIVDKACKDPDLFR